MKELFAKFFTPIINEEGEDSNTGENGGKGGPSSSPKIKKRFDMMNFLDNNNVDYKSEDDISEELQLKIRLTLQNFAEKSKEVADQKNAI